MYDWLHEAIAAGAEVVTSSRRLARELRAACEQRQVSAGARAWLAPPISFWGDWLRSRYTVAGMSRPLPMLLGRNASALLWERCLREQVDEELLNFPSLVKQAESSWQLLHDYRVPLQKLGEYPRGDDQQRFLRAARDYLQLLERRDWIDGAGVMERVAALLRDEVLEAPNDLIHCGFDRLTPAVEHVFDALRARGCEPRQAPCRADGAAVRLLEFADVSAELRSAGSWARQRLADAPRARLAVVRAGLESSADQAARQVREGLAPGWQYGGADYCNAVNVSYGRRLADYPAIGIARLCLKWLHAGLASRDISLLLRSRLLGGSDIGGRSRLELRLRRLPDRNWTPASLLAALRGADESADAEAWLDAIERLEVLRRSMPRRASPAGWADLIDGALESVAWPGAGTPDSEEFQLLNRWRSLLNEFAALEPVLPRLELAEALRHLDGLAADCIFQPQSTVGLIDLLGALEAAGMEFDGLWISGLDAGRWPPAGNPSLLLPRALQREFAMPDATPEDTRSFARRLYERLKTSAGEVVLSWAAAEHGEELLASPLLHDCTAAANDIDDPGWHAASLQGRWRVVDVGPDPAPPIAAAESVAGGAYTVANYATEPFSAFAYGRLRVGDLAPFETGLSASLRGSIVHDALHELYRDLPTVSDLQSWGPGELRQRVESATDAAVRRRKRHSGDTQIALLELERLRVQRLLMQLVEIECTRPDFALRGVEERIDFERHGVRLRLRVDRIDRLDDGTMLVIDYKTGAAKRLLNREGEPKDPQLVVYALGLDTRIGGLALLNIDSREIRYSGAGGYFEKDDAAAASFPARLAAWQEQVDAMLQGLAAGDARVNVLQASEDGRALNILSRLQEMKRDL